MEVTRPSLLAVSPCFIFLMGQTGAAGWHPQQLVLIRTHIGITILEGLLASPSSLCRAGGEKERGERGGGEGKPFIGGSHSSLSIG